MVSIVKIISGCCATSAIAHLVQNPRRRWHKRRPIAAAIYLVDVNGMPTQSGIDTHENAVGLLQHLITLPNISLRYGDDVMKILGGVFPAVNENASENVTNSSPVPS